jgi:uncharacterized protein (TIGR00369 family)
MKLPAPEFANPDQALIHRFLAGDGRPLPFDANPLARALGAELRAADPQAGRATLAFSPGPQFLQGAGMLQGGVLTAMLDFAMAYAVLAQMPLGGSCATVNLSVAFLRPAPQGRYLAHGEIERRGRHLAFTRAQLLREEDGRTVATATSTLALMEP